jgi:hypothetical protein
MTEKVSEMGDEQFVAVWNGAATFDEAVEQVRAAVGKAPRWVVLARASALRRQGVSLRRHEVRGRAG